MKIDNLSRSNNENLETKKPSQAWHKIKIRIIQICKILKYAILVFHNTKKGKYKNANT